MNDKLEEELDELRKEFRNYVQRKQQEERQIDQRADGHRANERTHAFKGTDIGSEGADALWLERQLHAEDALGLELGWQTVGVPSEDALHAFSALCLVTSDDVLDVTGEEMAVVWQTVREGRAVIEHELIAGSVID